LPRVLGERAVEDLVELRRQVLATLSDRRHRRVYVRGRLRSRRLAVERPLAAEQLVGDDG
jgi:hypothetical protein